MHGKITGKGMPVPYQTQSCGHESLFYAIFPVTSTVRAKIHVYIMLFLWRTFDREIKTIKVLRTTLFGVKSNENEREIFQCFITKSKDFTESEGKTPRKFLKKLKLCLTTGVCGAIV